MTVKGTVGRTVAPRPVPCPPPLRERLRSTPVAWLTTVRRDGAPHLVPVWYLWADGGFVVFSKPAAAKVQNVQADGRVMLAIGEPEDDFDVQLVEGEARVLPSGAFEVLPALAPQLLAKYAGWMAAIGLTLGEFAETYRSVIRIEPTRFLGWRGRTGGRALGRPGREIVPMAGREFDVAASMMSAA
jgi:PPOX class probable F420-dependent enzyme